MKNLGKNNMFKRVFAFILAVLMVFTMMPLDLSVMKAEEGAGGEPGGETPPVTEQITYTFNVSAMISSGEDEPEEKLLNGATVTVYASERLTATTEGGVAEITLPAEYTSVEDAKELEYEIRYDYINDDYIKYGILGTETTINAELAKETGLEGVIYLDSDKTPAVNYSVTLYIANNGEDITTTKTRNDGSFVFIMDDDFVRGENTYNIRVESTEYTSDSCCIYVEDMFARRENTITDAGEHTLILKDAATLTFSESTTILEKDATFTNTLTCMFEDEDVSLGTQAELKYSSSDENVVTVDETTGEVTAIAPGTATIKASFHSYDYRTSTATYTVSVKGFTYNGAVKDTNGNPVNGATVYLVNETDDLTDLENTKLVEVTTGEDGTYSLTYDQYGNYKLVVLCDGYEDKVTEVYVETGDSGAYVAKTIADIELVLITYNISGNVTLDGNPVADGQAISLLKDEDVVATTTTIDGAYTFTDIAPGTYIVRVDSEEYKEASRTLNVELADADSMNNDMSLLEKDVLTLETTISKDVFELLTNLEPDQQVNRFTFSTSIVGEYGIAPDEDSYTVTFSSSNPAVVEVAPENGEVIRINGTGTATITATIESDDYKIVFAEGSTYACTVNVWTLAFVNQELTGTIETIYGDEAFSTKAVLVAGDVVKEMQVSDITYESENEEGVSFVYVDAEGNEVEASAATDVLVKVLKADENPVEISATYKYNHRVVDEVDVYDEATISYDVKVNKITELPEFKWTGYDETTDVVDGNIVVNYAFGGPTKPIAVTPIEGVDIVYTVEDDIDDSDIIIVDSANGTISAINGIGTAVVTATINDTNYDIEPITYTINVTKGQLPDLAWNATELETLNNDAQYSVSEIDSVKHIETTYKKDIVGFTLTAQSAGSGSINYVYSSSNDKVATVNSSTGEMTIVGAGETIITCVVTSDFYEDTEITYKLVVKPAGQNIVWDPIDWTIGDVVIDGGIIELEFRDELTHQITIENNTNDSDLSSGFVLEEIQGYTDVATVDNTGLVTVNNIGQVKVNYYSKDNDANVAAGINRYQDLTIVYTFNIVPGKQNLAWNTANLTALDAFATFKDASGAETSTLPLTGGSVNVVYDKEHTAFTLGVDGANADLTYSYAVSGNDDNVITFNEATGEVTINKAGTVVITYKATNDQDILNNYEVKEASYTLVISENPQTALKWDTAGLDTSKVNISQLTETNGTVTMTYNPDFTAFKIGITGQIDDAKLATNITSSNTDVATVGADGTITIVKSGTTTITYTSVDTTECYANKTLTYTLTINKADQNGFVWSNGTNNGTTLTITYDKNNMERNPLMTATTPQENAQVTYAITSGDAVVITDATTSAMKVNKSGTVTIKASIQETTNYNAKTIEYKVVVNKNDQVMTFSNANPSFINGGAFTQPQLTMETDANGAVTYEIIRNEENAVSAIDPQTGALTFTLQPGTVVVRASRDTDEKYNGTYVEYTLTVNMWNPLAGGSVGTYYAITGTKIDNTSVWYTTVDSSHPIRLNAQDGYQLYKGTEDPVPSTTWSSYIDVSDITEGTNNSITYYIRETATGYVSKQYAVGNFHVDTVAPNAGISVDGVTLWEKFLSFFTFDLLGQDTPELMISSSDATSGVKTVYYYISDGVVPMTKNGSLDVDTLEDTATWEVYTSVVDLGKEDVTENVIYTKVVDNAGHVTYSHTNGLIFDSAKPVATPTVVTKDSNGIYFGDVEINLDVVDAEPYSGIQQITYVVENGSTVTDRGTLFAFQPAEAGNPKQSELVGAWNSADYGKNVIVKAADNNSDNVKVTFTVTDNIGNETVSVVNLKIDITAPVVTVSYDNNNGDTTFSNAVYYNANRTATITVKERHFDTNNVTFTITNTDGTMPALSGWTKVADGTGNGDDTTYQASVVFGADGDYTFDFSCVDSASNSNSPINYGTSQAPTAFTIDKTVPMISVSYNNNEAMNENYYKADRTATIVIQEHNFDASRVNAIITATDNGQTIGAPSISGWSSSGDTHTATISYSSDALYTFDIEYADKAGNEIADFAPETFYVDKTMPSLSITEITDLSANNDETIGFVITATDTNFDVFTPVVTAVIQTENGFTTTEVNAASISEITNGSVYTVNNLESDGIYSIKCTVVDKAGNAYTEVNLQREDGSTYVENRSGEDTLIMFSVNRDGSVFDVNDNTKAILDKYYVQNVEEDIVVYEVNTDELSTYSVSLNGQELTEGTDYTVSSTGGNGEWMRYTYTINKALFEAEGEYVLVVSSTDDAENNAFSDVKNANIKFVVDRTAPVVTVSGMETGRSYQTDRQVVTLMPTDDGGIVEMLTVRLVDRDGNVEAELINLSGEELRETLESNGGTITFELTEGINQNVQVICADGAYNAEGTSNTFNQTYENITVSASAIAIFFAGNTMLYIGGGAAATAAVAGGGVFFFKRFKLPKVKK